MLYDDTELDDLPFPVARATARMRRAVACEIPERAIDAFFEVIEESTRILAIELLSAALRTQAELSPPIIRLMGKRRSFGDRVQLLLHLVRLRGGASHIDSLRAALGKRGAGLASRLTELVRMRNQFAHGARLEGAALDAFLASVQQTTDELEPLAEAVRGLRLLSVFSEPASSAATVLVMDWMGPSPTPCEISFDIPDSLERRDLRSGSVLAVRGAVVLPLGPFMIGRDDPSRDEPELFALENLGRSAEGLCASWSNLGDHMQSEPPGGVDDVAAFRDLLDAWESASNAELSRDARLQSYYFSSTPALMGKLLERYVERRGVPEALERLFEAGRSGTLWIVAGPGAGKSTVIASVVHQHEAVHHFVSSSEGRNNQPAIFRSLVAQLIRQIDADELPHDEDHLLPQQFANLLARRAMSQTDSEVVVVALDAVDELGDETAIVQFVEALPSELPDRVFLLVSSRPLPPGLRLPTGATQYVLDPLSVGDIQRVARMHGLPDSARECERAFVASHGNPLLAVWALTLLRDNPDLELADTEEFDDVLSPLLARPMLGPMGTQAVRILAVLVAARGRLDLATLSVACGLDRLATLQVIATLRDVLSLDKRSVVVSHQAVRDYLLRPTSVYGLDQTDLAAAYAALDDLAQLRPGSVLPQDRLWYAVNSAAPERISIALSDPTFRVEFPSVVSEFASAGGDVLSLLQVVATMNELPSRQLVAESAKTLALSGHWATASRVLEASWADQLSQADRRIVQLEVARAADNVAEIATLADQLLDELANDESHLEVIPRLYLLKGESARVGGHHAEAMVCYERAIALSVDGSNDKFTAVFQLADLLYVQGRLDVAGERLATLLTQARIAGDLVWETRVLREIGHLDLSRGRRVDAAEWYRRSLDLALGVGRKRLIAQGYTSTAEALASVDPSRALEMAEVGIEHGVAAGAATELGKVRTSMAEAYLTLGELEEAVRAATDSYAELVAVGYGSGQARARLVRAEALLHLGEVTRAEEDANAALSYYRNERIYPHLWLSALKAMARARGWTEENPEFGAMRNEIPYLDQLGLD